MPLNAKPLSIERWLKIFKLIYEDNNMSLYDFLLGKLILGV